MKGRYSFTQTVHTGPQGTVPVKVKHDYEGAVPMTEPARMSRYLTQNGAPSSAYGFTAPAHLTVNQLRQIRRARRRSIARAVKTVGQQAA